MPRELGWVLIGLGLLAVCAGLVLLNQARLPWLQNFWPQGLPGDIIIRRPGFTFYFPLGACSAASLIMSLIFWLWRR